MTRAIFRSIAHAVPEKVLTNKDLEKLVDTSDEWIVQRTGIRERRVCAKDEYCSTLCIRCGREAIEKAGISPLDVDLVIVGTVTGDRAWPATSAVVQDALGCKNAGALDVGTACAGFISSVSIASAMIEAGHLKTVLVIGVDVLSKYLDYTDRSVCILFGDGGGAAVLSAGDEDGRGVLDTVLMSDGSGSRFIGIDVGGSYMPAHCWDRSGPEIPYVYMAGSEVYRFAVGAMGDACLKLLDRAGMTSDQIDLFVPHQANMRIIDSAAKKLNLPDEKVFVNVDRYGNTSAGSIPIALSEAVEQGRLKPGMLVMTVGFGAGLMWGANLIRW